jgi:hypothetical protein
MTSVWSLRRNDVAAALEFYRRAKAAGSLTDAEVRVLARLQDDPTEFFSEIAKLTR